MAKGDLQMKIKIEIPTSQILSDIDFDEILEYLDTTDRQIYIAQEQRIILFKLILQKALDRSCDIDQDIYQALVDFKDCFYEAISEADEGQVCFGGNDILEVWNG
jgi:hypothetical protein